MELTTRQAAKVLGVADMTIRNWVTRGALSARRVGLRRYVRIRVDDLRAFAAQSGYEIDEDKLRDCLSD